jgi:hypothetical protein
LVENLTHFDTKQWSTLKLIFTKPGQLTKDFVEGKRARYVHPIRFYVFTSVIFFALLSVVMDRSIEKNGAGAVVNVTDKQDPKHQRRAYLYALVPDSLQHGLVDISSSRIDIPIDTPYYRAAFSRLRMPTKPVLDSLLATGRMDDTLPGTRRSISTLLASLPDADSLMAGFHREHNGMVTSYRNRRDERIMTRGNLTTAALDSMLGADADSLEWWERRALIAFGRLNTKDPSSKMQFAHGVTKAFSVIMFILMPFTALLLMWLFARKRFYWEHLIFSIHTHTIFFLFFILLLAFALLAGVEIPDGLRVLLALVCAAYLLLALRRVYGRPWGSTVLRFVLMGIPYLFISMVLMVAGMLWGLFTL